MIISKINKLQLLKRNSFSGDPFFRNSYFSILIYIYEKVNLISLNWKTILFVFCIGMGGIIWASTHYYAEVWE